MCIWDLSSFFRKVWIAIYFPLMTAFAVSQRFWAVVLFSLAYMYFLISSLTSWLAHSFFSRMFFTLQVFVTFPNFFLVVDLQFHSIVVWKYAWYDLDLFVLVEGYLCPSTWFILKNIPCALEKNVYSAALGYSVLNISVKSIWSSVSFKAIVSFGFFD